MNRIPQEEKVVMKILRVIEEQSLAQWDLTDSITSEVIKFSLRDKNDSN